VKYALGIDVGTSYTAVATWRLGGGQQSRAEVVPLGNRTASVASVLFLGADGSVLVGDAAQRRALTDPDRVVREFKRRIGDDTPLFVGGEPYAAHDLAATVVRWVVDRVAEREGGPADHIAITHPAGWGPYKKDLLRTALSARGLDDLTFLTEPEAAAINYASQERIAAGATIAVYDLGGGTFDAAVVRKTGVGSFELLGPADGLEQLGGADFDEAVFTHVWAALSPVQVDALNGEDPDVLTALARLRRECTEAKETLSSDTEVSIPVLLPGVSSHVRLGRGEFEEMIRPHLQDTIDSLSRALRGAGVTNEDLDAVLLVGGSSRMPLVSQLVSAELGCPVVVDADPKATIALGAALSMATQATPATSAMTPAAGAMTPAAGTVPPATSTMAPTTSTMAPTTSTMAPVAGDPAPPTGELPRQFPAVERAPMPSPGPWDGPAPWDGDGQAPNRPPVLPAKPEASRSRGRIGNDPAQRSKLVAAALAVVTVGVIASAVLVPSAARALGLNSPAAEETTAPSQVDPSPSGAAAAPDPTVDPEKMSIAGPGSRGRQGTTAPTSTVAGRTITGTAAPAGQGAGGGQAATPAPTGPTATSTSRPAPAPAPGPAGNDTPDPTPVPTPDPTPEPTPDPTPVPTPEPTSDPTDPAGSTGSTDSTPS